MKNTFT